MTFIERTDLRKAQCKIFQDDANPLKKQLVDFAHDVHYHDGTTWQDADETVVAGTLTGFAHKVDRLRHVIHMGTTGTRRWMPRRNVPGEYVEFGRLQSWGGTAWANVNLGTPTRVGNTLVFNTSNFKLTLLITWRQVKIEVVLKTAAALRRLRWQVSLVGLTWDNWGLYSGETLVGTVDRPTAWDANGSPENPNITINTSYAAGYVEFGGDVAGATLPITIDPTLTAQPDAAAGLDTQIDQESPDTPKSDNAFMMIGNQWYSGDLKYRGLLKFDVSSIPADATCDDATLSLWHFDINGSNTSDTKVYRQLRAWVEAQATWNIYSTGNSWATAGGFGATDCEQTEIGSRSMSSSETNGEKQWSLSASAVQDWWDGGLTNNGILMKAAESTSDAHSYRSSDYATAGERPKLVVNYTEAGGGAVSGSVILTGNSNYELNAYQIVQALSQLLSNGDLISQGLLIIPSDVTLSGNGYLLATAFIQALVEGQVILSGQGDLILNALNLIGANTSLSGEALLTLQSLVLIYAQGVLSGQVDTQFDSKILINSLIEIVGREDSSFYGKLIINALNNLYGNADLSSVGLLSILSNAELIGSGDILPAGILSIPSNVQLSGFGYLIATAFIEGLVNGTVSLYGSGEILSNALKLIYGYQSLDGYGNITPSSVLTILNSISLEGLAFLIASGFIVGPVVTVTGEAVLYGRGDLISTALNIVLGQSINSAEGILSAQGLVTLLANAILNGEGNIEANSILLISAIVALSGIGAITAIGTIPSAILASITPLSRTLVIPYEDRVYVIDQEGRVYMIKADKRDYDIES